MCLFAVKGLLCVPCKQILYKGNSRRIDATHPQNRRNAPLASAHCVLGGGRRGRGGRGGRGGRARREGARREGARREGARRAGAEGVRGGRAWRACAEGARPFNRTLNPLSSARVPHSPAHQPNVTLPPSSELVRQERFAGRIQEKKEQTQNRR